MSEMKIHFVISPSVYAQEVGKACIARWGDTHIFKATHVVALGGDGTALFARHEMLSAYLTTSRLLPIYDIDCNRDNRYHVGALMNKKLQSVDEIVPRIEKAIPQKSYPLRANYWEVLPSYSGLKEQTVFGFNEICVKLQTYQVTHLGVEILSLAREIKKSFVISGDGMLIATPMGKTAYYDKAGGAPFQDNELGIQGICAGRDTNHIISDNSIVNIEVKSHHNFPHIMRDCGMITPQPVTSVSVYKSKVPVTSLVDPHERD